MQAYPSIKSDYEMSIWLNVLKGTLLPKVWAHQLSTGVSGKIKTGQNDSDKQSQIINYNHL